MQRNSNRVCKFSIFALMGVVVFCLNASATDRYFTNVLGGNFTNKTLWMTGIVPTNNDRVFFTNNVGRQIDWTVNDTNASAFFNTTVDTTFTQNVGSVTWYITNQLMIAQTAAQTSTVTLTSGTIVVTNGLGTASVVAGGGGRGTLNLYGGDMIVDHIYQTNFMLSDIDIDLGSTLTILGDSRFATNNTATSLGVGMQSSAAFSELIILGGTTTIESNQLYLGSGAGGRGRLVVSGSSSVLAAQDSITMGNTAGSTGEIYVTNGGSIFNLNGVFMDSGSTNLIVVSGAGSTFTNAQEVYVGQSGSSSFNQVIVSNGGYFSTRQMILGSSGNSNSIIVTDGGHFHGGTIGHNLGSASSSNSYMIITGAGSIADFENSVNMGANSTGIKSTLTISDGGAFSNVRVRLGEDGGENTILITDVGSYMTNTGRSWLGVNSGTNTWTISNGGAYYGFQIQVSSNFNAINNKLVIDGNGSIMKLSANFLVGSNANNGFGKGSVIVQNGGTLETPSITNGLNGFGEITNSRGIYQFATADPNIFTNAGGHIVITNGTISFRAINNAPVFITNDLSRLTWQGSNSYMLNAATNSILSSYIFTNGLGPTNYNQLVLINAGSMWQATNTLVGVGASIYVTNSTATTFGTITNSGSIQIAGPATTVTNLGLVVLNGTGNGGVGSLINLTGTNTFEGHTRLGATSTIATFQDQLTMDGTLTNNSLNITITNAGSSKLILGSDIQGSGGLTHNGTGTLVLSGNNTYFSGVVTNNVGGIIETASITGLGTGNVVMNGGQINYTTVNQIYSQTFTINGAVTQSVASGIEVALGTGNNDITGSGLIVKQGAGYLYLTNNVSQNNTGGWRIDDGRVIINFAGNPLGTGTVTLNGGILKQESSASTLINPFSVTADSTIMFTNGSDLTLSSSSISGTAGTLLTLTDESGVPHSDTLTFTGSNFTYAGDIDIVNSDFRLVFAPTAPSSTDPNGISATNYFTGMLTNRGNTTLTVGAIQILTNITVVFTHTNFYNGTTRVQHGTLLVESEGALGTTAGATAITNNGTLAFLSNFTYSSAESIVLSSTGGVRGVGLVGVGGTNRFAGYITNTTDSSIGTWAGNLTLSGGMLVTNSLLITNAANSVLTNSGIIVGSGPITHNGSGTVVFTGANTFNGAVTNNNGNIEIISSSGLGTTTSVVLNGGTLLFKGSLTNTSAAVVLNGGTISELDTNVSLGAMTVSANSIVSLGSGGAAGRLTFASGTNTVGSGAKLTIYGWSWNSALSGGSDDLIFFTSTTFETASFLNNVTFFGTGGGARVLSSGELVPITPEPSSIVSGSILLALIVKRFRKRSP